MKGFGEQAIKAFVKLLFFIQNVDMNMKITEQEKADFKHKALRKSLLLLAFYL